ncbi:DUF5753 domain-containing protein [Nocardia sp. NPDC057030]|uniref:DUF5753 domain-containing protein n=1 Tax=unclassified Nocardia TaxID=2637762 RepID=UPI003637D99A
MQQQESHEWRDVLGTGLERRQQRSIELEAETTELRVYQTQIVPGLLQTAEYAEALMRRLVDFYRIPDDIERGVAARMARQRVLHQSGHQFNFLIAEQSLYSTVGGENVMCDQLDRLASTLSMPRIRLEVIPAAAEVYTISTSFVMFDDRTVMVEGTAAELTITQPREIAIYRRAFDTISKQAVTGVEARALIMSAIEHRRGAESQPPIS